MGKYNFPKIKEITIHNFSLYKKDGKIVDIDETVSSGIFCLAGANGLGKSTFLNIVNYGLTGLVLEPSKRFFSPGEMISKNSEFTDTYFDGRIKAKERKSAKIELLFTIGNKYYKISRSFKEVDSLTNLEIYEIINNEKIFIPLKKNMSPEELNKKYKDGLAKDTGLNNFDYFAFLQLYVFTFDETRRLLFWDKDASSNALSIAFNASLDDHEKIVRTTRKMERYESLGRNHRWQATQIMDKINDLIKNFKSPTANEEMEYEKLCREYDASQKAYENISIEYDSLLKNRNYLHSDILSLRSKYREYFSLYSEPLSKLLNNYLIKTSIDKKECIICGARGEFIADKINENIHKDYCPLCNTNISDNVDDNRADIFDSIKKIDNEIVKKESELNDLIIEIQGKELLKNKSEFDYRQLQEKKMKVEHEFPQISGSNTDIGVLLMKLDEQFKEFDKKSKENYEKRDKLKPVLGKLQKKTKAAYIEAEVEFVPIFKNLAKSFIGYDLDISLETKGRNLILVLELNNSVRTESHKLSESQRFFLDIALRMALAIYLSAPENEATLIIDTPEGSLDIAYESRAGEMFAEFINKYSQNMLMTANINSSQLLVSLAQNCKNGKMDMKRMLNWIDLSIVQIEEELLFKKCFDNIESILRRKK
jgi:DNA repair exonuclease SbcCD ATPase subunit